MAATPRLPFADAAEAITSTGGVPPWEGAVRPEA